MSKNPDFAFVYLFYLINNDSRNFFKIGLSKNPYKRLQQISSSTPHHLSCIRYYFSHQAHKEEQELHNLLKDRRYKNEWFEFESFDLAVLLFEDFFNVKDKYFIFYQHILKSFTSLADCWFLNCITKLVDINDEFLIIQILSNHDDILDKFSSLKSNLEYFIKQYLGNFIKVNYSINHQEVFDINIINHINKTYNIIENDFYLKSYPLI